MNKQTKMIFAIKKKVLVKSFDLVKPKMNVGPTESRYRDCQEVCVNNLSR